ncbi:MAG: hypothetical protein JXN64_04665 [Spirochaetes bacterium]|nr:hypothetical protein [Spirochaetota bacterium]
MKIIKNIFVLLIIIILPLISCKKNTQREKEPNNNFVNANEIEPDMVIEGLLDTPFDHDFYKLIIVTPFVMDIKLTSVKGINHAVKIWKDTELEQLVIKYIDDSRKSSTERMCNMFFDAGVYYIEILHGERDNPQGNEDDYYELHLSSKNTDDEEKESNDSPESANLIEIGREIKGYFSPAFNKLNRSGPFPSREEDWYYFDVDLEDDQPVLLDALISNVPDVKSVLYLFDSERKELASSGTYGAGDGGRLEGIGIMKPGRYYIMAASNFESNHSIPYRLQVTARNYDYSTEIEPNNSFDTANLIMKNEISAKIFPDGDMDFYLYNIQNAVREENQARDGQNFFRIEASSESLNLLLRIFDDNKNKLFEIDNLKVPGKEVMPNALLKNNFYIEVSSKRGEDSSSGYNLNVSFFPYSGEYELEPNDTKETATRVKSDKIAGFISKKGDKDFYLFEYKKRVRKKFIVNGIQNSKLKAAITDPLGFVVKSETVDGADSVSFSEMIDSKGYLIIESVVENYDEPYIIELGD